MISQADMLLQSPADPVTGLRAVGVMDGGEEPYVLGDAFMNNRDVSRFRPLYYKDKSDATYAQYTRVLIYATQRHLGFRYRSSGNAFFCTQLLITAPNSQGSLHRRA